MTYLLVRLLTVGSLIIQLLGRLQLFQPTRIAAHVLWVFLCRRYCVASFDCMGHALNIIYLWLWWFFAIVFNDKKSKYLWVEQSSAGKLSLFSKPDFCIGGARVNHVNSWPYLSHITSCIMTIVWTYATWHRRFKLVSSQLFYSNSNAFILEIIVGKKCPRLQLGANPHVFFHSLSRCTYRLLYAKLLSRT